jgi:hypothetical protein
VNGSWTVAVEDSVAYEASPTVGGLPACDTTRGLWAQDRLGAAHDPPANSEVRFTFSAATGTGLVGLTYVREFYKLADQAWDPGFLRIADSPVGTPLDGRCTIDPSQTDECLLTGLTSRTFAPTSRLEFGLRCSPNVIAGMPTTVCLHGAGGGHYARAELRSADVTVQDDGAPTVTNLDGTAFATWPRGTRTVVAEASDASGIASARVIVDGTAQPGGVVGTCRTVAGVAGAFTTPKPCDDHGSDAPLAATLDLSGVADGAHTVTLRATDPAGNAGAAPARTIIVDQTAPTAPAPLTLAGGPADDATWVRALPVGATWTVPGGQVAPIAAAHARACRTGGACTNRSTGAAALDAGDLASLLADGDGTYDLGVSLEDTAGNGETYGAARAATRTVRVDRTAPASPVVTPTGLDAGLARPGFTSLTVQVPPGQASPVDRAWLHACDAAGCRDRLVPLSGPGSTSANGGGAIVEPAELAAVLAGGATTVAVSLVDRAGNGADGFDVARAGEASLAVVAGPPGPPQRLRGLGTQTTPTFRLAWDPPAGQVAPLDAALVELCPVGGACTTVAVAGDVGEANIDASVPDTDTRVRVWLRDVLGQEDPAQAATGTLRYAPPGGGTPDGPGGPDSPGEATRTNPRLRLTSARHDRATRRLVLAGTARPGARLAGTARIEARPRRGRVRTHRLAVRVVADARGRWAASVRLPVATGRVVAAARAVRVRLSTRATTTALAATTPARTVSRR